MKRLVIYFHYDPAGCIDTACRIAVQAVQKYGSLGKLVIVCFQAVPLF